MGWLLLLFMATLFIFPIIFKENAEDILGVCLIAVAGLTVLIFVIKTIWRLV